MTDMSLIEFRLKTQDAKIVRLEQHIEALEERAAKNEAARIAGERKQLLAGISFLGAIILTLSGVIWSYRGIIFKGST